jgi:hypothetical protein
MYLPNHLSRTRSLSRSIFVTLALAALSLLAMEGCHKTVDDATLANNVKAALAGDSAIGQQPVQVAVQQGVVTLTGNVSDDTASSLAAEDAAKISGTKEVVNDLTVAGLTLPPTVTLPAAPGNPRPATPQEQQAIAQNQSLPPPAENTPPPPPPVYRDVTAPAGTPLHVRITESLDSATAQDGESFHGIVTRQVVADGLVVIPAGSAVNGRVVDAKDATHFKGHSILSVEITGVRTRGHQIALSTDPYTLDGANRGKNSVEKIGGGAVVGAVLGGIFGGGKGAAIGAGAGGGGGAAVQGFTRGQQVAIPSESVIFFRLAAPVTVHTMETPALPEPPEGQSR